MEKKHIKTEQKPFTNGRRDFMKLAGLLSAGMLLPGSAYPFFSNGNGVAAATGRSYLSGFILMEKAAMLAQGDSRMGSLLRYALHTDPGNLVPGNSFFTGMAFPFSDSELLSAMARLKSEAKAGQLNYKQTGQLAIMTGALVYRAVNSHLAEADKHSALAGISAEKVNHYRDAALIRQYYLKGKPEEPGSKVASLLKQMVTRSFIRFHTVMPDERAGADWVLAMQDWRKHTDNYYEQLGTALLNPDAEMYDRVVVKAGFLDITDPWLVRVSTFNRISGLYGDEGMAAIGADGATDTGKVNTLKENASGFAAKALLAGSAAILYVDDFWRGAISEKQLADRLGVQG